MTARDRPGTHEGGATPGASGIQSRGALRFRPVPVVPHGSGAALREAIAARRPLVVTDLAADWPAMRRWSPERLAHRHGARRVRVYDATFGAPGRKYMGSIDTMSFAEFLEQTQVRARDLRMFLYNLSHQIPELLDDIRIPEVGLRFSRRFVFSFFGCRGSTTPLHYDIDMGEVLHTVIRGRRRVRLFGPEASAALYRHPCTVRSYVDLDAPDIERFPALTRAAGLEVVLEPGQTLYMPGGWWHEFHYLEAGMSVSLRAPPRRWVDRLEGARNLMLLSPFDRLANRCAPRRWHRWKTRQADRRARALAEPRPRPAGPEGETA